MRHVVGSTQDGVEVYAILTSSAVGKRLARQPQLLALAREVLADVTLHHPVVYMESDLHRQIGYDFVVPTTEKDTVFYARLVKEATFTRFVKNSQPKATSYLTLVLQRDADQKYELLDIWIGRQTPPLPGSDDEIAASKPYWSSHALIHSDQPIQTQSLTKTCPYE